MADLEVRTALGLMSGTSCDGIDAALVTSDGQGRLDCGDWLSRPYDEAFRQRLLEALRQGARAGAPDRALERELTLRHAKAVKALLDKSGCDPREVAVIGFHGHTLYHQPEQGRTCQIGDGALLAAETGIDVVYDFRSRDMAEGGQGAPLAPLFHAALAAGMDRPVAVLNIGGVANLTWIGAPSAQRDGLPALIAFDTGPGNALIDEWVAPHCGEPLDRDGALAAAGRIDEGALARLLDHPFFDRPPPKSLDRYSFDPQPVEGLGAADGAATLTAFTAAAVARGLAFLPEAPRRWLVTGGGRHNPSIMAALRERLEAPVEAVEGVGWHGDALEAQAFAYLALRSLAGLPLTLPGTTGVARPIGGGRLARARS